ncbi:MAG: HEAT repeat domain-containing protein [Thermodesulfovibrionales bacterium]|nr:HEAT repeat domain-containing protein [Thermodesulfovibrionales bacterium]
MWFSKPNIENMKRNRDVEGLIKALNHKDDRIRFDAICALRDINDGKIKEPFILDLQDKNSSICIIAAEVLGNMKERRAIKYLIQLLSNENADVRGAAIWALGEILQEIKDIQVLEHIISVLNDKYINNKELARQIIEDFGKQAVEPLIKALNHEDPEIVAESAFMLGEIGDVRAVEPLIQAFQNSDPNDSEPNVREAIVFALGEIGDKRAINFLLQALKDIDLVVGYAAENALGQINPKWRDTEEAKIAAKNFISFIKDDDPNVRQAIAFALGVIGDRETVEHILSLLNDKYSRVRLEAARALKYMKDPRAIEPLIQVLEDDKNSDVRNEAKRALEEITGQNFGIKYHKWKMWWQENKSKFGIA